MRRRVLIVALGGLMVGGCAAVDPIGFRPTGFQVQQFEQERCTARAEGQFIALTLTPGLTFGSVLVDVTRIGSGFLRSSIIEIHDPAQTNPLTRDIVTKTITGLTCTRSGGSSSATITATVPTANATLTVQLFDVPGFLDDRVAWTLVAADGTVLVATNRPFLDKVHIYPGGGSENAAMPSPPAAQSSVPPGRLSRYL